MDLKAKISIDPAMEKEKQFLSSKQKQKEQQDRSEYLDFILISTGHLSKDTKKDQEIHLFFF